MKRPSLAASVKAAAAAEPEAAPPAPATAPATVPATVPAPARMPAPSNDGEAAPKSKRAATRDGRKAVYAFMDQAEHLRLKRLSVDSGKTIDALVGEAVRLLFAQHGV